MMKLIKEIKSKNDVLHFRRWSLFSSKYFSIYIHGIYKEDNDLHLHNHPWNILTIIFYGSYIEELETKNKVRALLDVGFRSRKVYHKINTLLTRKVFSLAFVFGKRDDNWGYMVKGNHVSHDDYRKNLNK